MNQSKYKSFDELPLMLSVPEVAAVRGIHMLLHNCLDRAVKERLILHNPTDDCRIPKLEKKEMHILKPEYISAYLKAAEARDVLPMFYLALTSGVRKGELVALL